MESCNKVAIPLDDLMSDDNRKAFQKIKEIQYFDAQNHVNHHVNGLRTSEDQIFSKDIENDSNREFANLQKEFADATNEVHKLQREKEVLSKTLEEKDSRLDSLKKEFRENKINREKELEKFRESHANNILKLTDEIEAELSIKKNIGDITEINEGNERFNQDIKTLKTKHDDMKKECKEIFEYWDINYCQSYIGEVCLSLQANMYHYVLPDQFTEELTYKIKDIEEDIEDEGLLNDDEREEALKRWDDLKERLRWSPSLEKTLKILQKEGDPMCHPDLTAEEAERVVDELNKQGRLKGRTSYEKVKKIIDMWKISTTLVQSLT